MKPSNHQSDTFRFVTILAHADWSKNPDRRWVALADLQVNHRWLISELVNAVEPTQYFQYLQSHQEQPGCILAGFDFPLGLPFAYASKTGITHFFSALRFFGSGEWRQFYSPAKYPSQVSLQRPFYPLKPGKTKRIHLEEGLDIPFKQLYRLCEMGHTNRRPACPLFWTMGSQQVGKAAISGWETLLSPIMASRDTNLKIWPFSGPMSKLLLPGTIVAVETYPAEFYGHIGISFTTPIRRSKRRQADRLAFRDLLFSWPYDHQIALSETIREKIQDGFGNQANGEDQFDALVGLYGMINIIQGNHWFGEPPSTVISNIEGWIFGQEWPKQVA